MQAAEDGAWLHCGGDSAKVPVQPHSCRSDQRDRTADRTGNNVCVCVSNQSVSATRAPPLVNVKDIYQNLAVGRVSCLYDYTSERHPGLVPVCRQSAPQRDYVVLAARTPPRDQTGEERGQASSATAAGTSLDHETDVEWVSEHARQVRMG